MIFDSCTGYGAWFITHRATPLASVSPRSWKGARILSPLQAAGRTSEVAPAHTSSWCLATLSLQWNLHYMKDRKTRLNQKGLLALSFANTRRETGNINLSQMLWTEILICITSWLRAVFVPHQKTHQPLYHWLIYHHNRNLYIGKL